MLSLKVLGNGTVVNDLFALDSMHRTYLLGSDKFYGSQGSFSIDMLCLRELRNLAHLIVISGRSSVHYNEPSMMAHHRPSSYILAVPAALYIYTIHHDLYIIPSHLDI